MRWVTWVRYWFLISLYALTVLGGAYYYFAGDVPSPLRLPLAVVQERVRPPTLTYALITRMCSEGRRGECQDLVVHAIGSHGTSTTVLDDALTTRYETTGGRARTLALRLVAPAGDQFVLEEVFSSSQDRQIFMFDLRTKNLMLLPWRYDPFAGDRVSHSGRYYARASDDFRSVEILDVLTQATTTPLRLTSVDETLAMAACGYDGKSPGLTWLTDEILSVDIHATTVDRPGACAGSLLRTVTLVVE